MRRSIQDCQAARPSAGRRVRTGVHARIVDGRVVTAPGVGPVAMVWLPLDGQVVAKIPGRKGNYRWLREAVRVRSPHLDDDRWHLPRNCLSKLVIAAVDRYGYVAVARHVETVAMHQEMPGSGGDRV